MNNAVQLLAAAIQLYSFLILARVILSWLPQFDRSNTVVDFIHQLTDPILIPVRNALPPMGGLDLSPLIVLVLLHLLSGMLMNMGGGM